MLDRLRRVVDEFDDLERQLADPEVIAATGLDRIKRTLATVLDADSKRVLFGTDYAMCDRSAHLSLVSELSISDRARRALLWENAAEVFRLELE